MSKVWVATLTVTRKNRLNGIMKSTSPVTLQFRDYQRLSDAIYKHIEVYANDLFECNVNIMHLDENDRRLW